MNTQLSISIKNNLQAVEKALDEFENFFTSWGLGTDVILTVRLCLEELLVNIVSYAFSDEQEHLISMDVCIENKHTLKIEIKDDGINFNPLEMAPEPNIEGDIEDRSIGGLGIYLVKSMMDRVAYHRRDEKNIFVMLKRIS